MFGDRTSSNCHPSRFNNGQRLKLPIIRNELLTGNDEHAFRLLWNTILSHVTKNMFNIKSRLFKRKAKDEVQQWNDTTSEEDSKDDSFSESFFETPIPYEAVLIYPPGYNVPKKLTSKDLSGVRMMYVVIMLLLSFAQLLHGSRYIGQCRLSPSMAYFLILEGILGIFFCLEESLSLIRSVKLAVSINGILTILYTITAFQVTLTYQPEYYEMESLRYCNVHFYNGTLLIAVIQAGIEFMLILYILILNSTF